MTYMTDTTYKSYRSYRSYLFAEREAELNPGRARARAVCDTRLLNGQNVKGLEGLVHEVQVSEGV